MDAKTEIEFSHPISVTGTGVAFSDSLNDLPAFLKYRKMRKFMGKQDQLAVIAASRAIQEAAVDAPVLTHRTGIYLSVGYIPFERDDIEAIARNSSQMGSFSMEKFSTSGFDQVNPLLTFRCLPNMPIFHVSLNLGIQGPYFITYPGCGQFYLALEQAAIALQRGEIDVALVGGVADQTNFLVQHHLRRMGQFEGWRFCDAAGFVVLECNSKQRTKLQWLSYGIQYEPLDPFDSGFLHRESFCGSDISAGEEYAGAASLAILLHQAKGTQEGMPQARDPMFHNLHSTDGISASSRWLLALLAGS